MNITEETTQPGLTEVPSTHLLAHHSNNNYTTEKAKLNKLNNPRDVTQQYKEQHSYKPWEIHVHNQEYSKQHESHNTLNNPSSDFRLSVKVKIRLY
jgi:hypothetical protein